jgi:hypothetical protein
VQDSAQNPVERLPPAPRDHLFDRLRERNITASSELQQAMIGHGCIAVGE